MLLGVQQCHKSGADSIRHGGTCPRFYKWLGTGGTESRSTKKQESDQTVLTTTKRSPKRLIVPVEPKTTTIFYIRISPFPIHQCVDLYLHRYPVDICSPNCIMFSDGSRLGPGHTPSFDIVPTLSRKTACAVALDKDKLSNYRPISNLSAVSKIIERIVKSRLRNHFTANRPFNPVQSACRKFHSTETVLLSLHDHIINAYGRQQVTCRCLLDHTAAFDTIDHSNLLDRLSKWSGLHGAVLNWVKSYLSNRLFQVKCSEQLSEPTMEFHKALYSDHYYWLLPSLSITICMLMTLGCSYLFRRLTSMKTSLTCRIHWVILLAGWLLTFCASIVLRLSSCLLVFDLNSTKFTILCFFSTMAHLFLQQLQLAILILT